MTKLNYNSIYFNSRDLFFKKPFGATECDSEISLKIFIPSYFNVQKVRLHLYEDNKLDPYHPKKKVLSLLVDEEKDFYTITFKTPCTPTLLFYYFEIIGQEHLFYGNSDFGFGGIGKIYHENPVPYQITTYYSDNLVPNWFKESIAYQIFPDRFFNGNLDKKILNPKKNSFIYGDWNDLPFYIKNKNGGIERWDFYGGNLKGIQEKLPYLKDLQVNLIYLNPIFEGSSNHRYDTANYLNIDPVLGTNDDFKNLITSCKNRGINIILDGVFNHTGKDSIYFNRFKNYNNLGAYNSKDSPYYDWYDFIDYPNTYRAWWGIDDLPCVNELSPSYFNFIIEDEDSVINTWMGYGIKGWRLDVADELPSYFIEELKYRCRELDPESIVLGEVWEEVTTKISYGQRRDYFNGKQLDSVMNYPLREVLLNFFKQHYDAEKLSNQMKHFKEQYPRENYYSLFNSLSSHDIPRIKTVIKDFLNSQLLPNDSFDTLSFDLLKSLSLLQFTLPGVPVIYYGDEAGVEGGKDPDNRRTYPWGFENIEILEWYKKITNLRMNSDILKRGEIKFFNIGKEIFGYIRYLKNSDDFILVVTNRSTINFSDFLFNLKDSLPPWSKVRITEVFKWNNPLNIPLDSSANFPIKIPPLQTLLFSNKRFE